MLEKKKEELQKSLAQLEQQFTSIQEQIVMHRGALQYNELILKELAEQEVLKESPVSVVE